jgi:hypothetical protein
VPAAGDRVSGPFKLTGLTAQSKGSNVSEQPGLPSLPTWRHSSISQKLLVATCRRTDAVAGVLAERSLETLGPTTFDLCSAGTIDVSSL